MFLLIGGGQIREHSTLAIIALAILLSFTGTAVAVDTIVASGDTLVVNLSNPFTLDPGDNLVIEDGGTLLIENDGTITNSGTVFNYGNLDIDGDLQNFGIIVFNDGNITIHQTGELNNNAQLSNYGTIINHGIFINNAIIVNEGVIDLYYDGTHSGMDSVGPTPVNIIPDPNQEIPEFPSLLIPVAAIIGLAIVFQRRKN